VRRLICWIWLLPAAASAATISSDDLARCARIATRDARLDCYDALAQRLDTAPSAPLAKSAPVPVAATAAATTQHASAPSLVPAPPLAPAPPPVSAQPAPAPATPAADDLKSFGLSPVQRHVAVVGPKEESARIVSMASNQAGHSTIVLDTGQTWTVLDDDGWLSSGDQVTIRRATLGSYLLIAPSRHSYKVHRIQ
jgi:hypothetical protein